MMEFDLDAWRFWIQLLAFGGSILAAIYAWWTARNQTTRTAIEENIDAIGKVDDRVDEVQVRIEGIERDMQHIPTQQDIRELAGQISTLHGDMKQLSGTLHGVRRAVDLMNEYLIKRDR